MLINGFHGCLLQVFSRSVKSNQRARGGKFAIDPRTPEELEKECKDQGDSEA